MKESEIRPAALFDRYLALSREDIDEFFADKRSFVDVACPACGGADQERGFEKLNFNYVICAACESLYVSPRPLPEHLDSYYRNSKAAKFWSTHFFKETAEVRREKMFRPRAALVQELLERYQSLDAGTFVDVGSGYGIFLQEVDRLKRFDVLLGIEPNRDLADVCRASGFKIVEKTVEATTEDDVQADFAAAFEVLEHVFDPLSFLQAARRVVRPGGILLFTTLTVSGFDIQVLWEHSKSVYPPHHINLISVEGMRRLVERAELNLVELATPGVLDVDIVANTLKENPALSLPRFVSYLLEHRDGAARQEFQNFLSRNLLSSHIRVVAKK